jgi:hypothetical protein
VALPFVASDLESHLVPLLTMAGDGDHGKAPGQDIGLGVDYPGPWWTIFLMENPIMRF